MNPTINVALATRNSQLTTMTFAVIGPFLYIMWSGKIDFGSPANLIRVRILFVSVMLFLLSLGAYIYLTIQKKNDTRKIRVAKGRPITFNKAAPSPGEESTQTPTDTEEEEITVAEHDKQACIAFLKDLGQTAMMMGVLHLYMGIVPPLVIQSLLKPYAFFTSSLAKTYLFSQPAEERPWVTPTGSNPFAKMFGFGGNDNNASQSSPEEPTPPRKVKNTSGANKKKKD